MAFRSEAAIAAILILAGPAGAEHRFDAGHEHWRKGCRGTLAVDEAGVAFTEIRDKPRKKPHAWQWPHHEIQQATLGRDTLRIVTYEDNALRLGADREHTFTLDGAELRGVRDVLRKHLDTRLVLTDPAERDVEWTVPAKLLRLTKGAQGTLEVSRDSIAFRTGERGRSREWRFDDIENITSTDAYSLTLTSFERSRLHYGGRRDFQFQLKQPIDPVRVDALWRRLKDRHGPHVLEHYTRQENRTQ